VEGERGKDGNAKKGIDRVLKKRNPIARSPAIEVEAHSPGKDRFRSGKKA